MEGPLRDLRQGIFKIPSGLFVPDGLQGAGLRFRFQDPLHRVSVKGMVPEGMLKRSLDVVAFVVLFHPEDGAGMEAHVLGVLFNESLEERIRCVT